MQYTFKYAYGVQTQCVKSTACTWVFEGGNLLIIISCTVLYTYCKKVHSHCRCRILQIVVLVQSVVSAIHHLSTHWCKEWTKMYWQKQGTAYVHTRMSKKKRNENEIISHSPSKFSKLEITSIIKGWNHVLLVKHYSNWVIPLTCNWTSKNASNLIPDTVWFWVRVNSNVKLNTSTLPSLL